MTFQTYGKWILSGEHSVLRGSPALVFPVHSCCLEAEYIEKEQPFAVEFSGESGKEYGLLFWSLVEDALKRLNKSRSDLKGFLKIESTLPVGTGLGASAALCVTLSRVFVVLEWLEEQEIYNFSRSLEDLFHGESSGVDIAVALSGKPLRFLRSGDRQAVELSWQPQWYISYSGQRGITSECVAKVKRLFLDNPEKAQRLDRQMQESVQKAESALKKEKNEGGFSQLMEAIRLGESCFSQWGLIEGSLADHIQVLKAAGAMACKPTGSGGGGFVLSLWGDEGPSTEIIKSNNLLLLGPF